jgi:hypothetical protein
VTSKGPKRMGFRADGWWLLDEDVLLLILNV